MMIDYDAAQTQRRSRRSVFAAGFGLAGVTGGVVQLLVVRRHDIAQTFTTRTMQKIFGVMLCLFAAVRLVSHPAPQNRSIDYVLMAVMFACGIFLLLAKKPQASAKK